MSRSTGGIVCWVVGWHIRWVIGWSIRRSIGWNFCGSFRRRFFRGETCGRRRKEVELGVAAAGTDAIIGIGSSCNGVTVFGMQQRDLGGVFKFHQSKLCDEGGNKVSTGRTAAVANFAIVENLDIFFSNRIQCIVKYFKVVDSASIAIEILNLDENSWGIQWRRLHCNEGIGARREFAHVLDPADHPQLGRTGLYC